jgi:DUF2075 family protein
VTLQNNQILELKLIENNSKITINLALKRDKHRVINKETKIGKFLGSNRLANMVTRGATGIDIDKEPKRLRKLIRFY